MIDLHTHTTYSDGRYTPTQLLEKATYNNIQILSITDHNHCLAYENLDVSLFSGAIIPGCEMATSFEGYVIEILGYGVEIKTINNWYTNFFAPEKLLKNEMTLFEQIYAQCQKLGLSLTKNLSMKEIVKGTSKKTIYNDLIKYPENLKILPKHLLSTYRIFFRQGLANPNSPLFASEHLFYPTLDETILLIKKSGGLTFLAHLFEYGLSDNLYFLEKLQHEANLDGLECFHPSFSKEQEKYLYSYALEKGLYVSGGSDNHGKIDGVSLGYVSKTQSIEKVLGMEWIDQTKFIN